MASMKLLSVNTRSSKRTAANVIPPESCRLPRARCNLIADSLSSGAGGLGCEILKNLALSGFKDIHVIDMG
jgi:hypothetical protein